jgi:hypothetical protein
MTLPFMAYAVPDLPPLQIVPADIHGPRCGASPRGSRLPIPIRALGSAASR